MAKLLKITVDNLFNEYSYEIKLSGESLTYVHSQNGMGKSTIMRLVYNVLSGDLEPVRTTPFDRLDLDFDDGTSVIVENRNQELTLQVSKAELEQEVSPEELRSIADVTYVGPDRAYLVGDDGSIEPALPVYMRELSDMIQAAKADSVLHDVKDDGRARSDADLDVWFRDLEAKVVFIEQAGFSPEVPPGYRFPPSRYEISQHRDDYRRLALQLQDYVDRYYAFAEDIVVYRDIVNSVYVDKTVGLNSAGYIEARMDRSGTTIPLSKFSSGEKQILIIFYIVLFKAKPGSLIILDEPEVSLHVSWQQQMGRMLKDVCRLRGYQIIAATHAPSVIHDDWDIAAELKGKDA